MTNTPKYLTKSRIGNIMAAYVIVFGLYVFVTQEISIEVIAILSGIMGIAAKHLWDVCKE